MPTEQSNFLIPRSAKPLILLYQRRNKTIIFSLSMNTKNSFYRTPVKQSKLSVARPYKPVSPFQFFFFLSSFLSKIFKKQTFFFAAKLKYEPGTEIDPFLLSETVLSQSNTLLKVWSFVLLNFNRKSVKAMRYFFHYFFLEFSKKRLPEVSKFFSSIKELMLLKRVKGFFWGQKGKIAWKALSRKQNTLLLFGSYSKVNYNLVASGTDYTYCSVTGTVFFKSNIFY